MEDEQVQIKHSSFWANLFKETPPKTDLESVITSVHPFKSFSYRDVKLLLPIIHNRAYTAGEFIFYQGDPGIGLYIVQEGEVVIERKIDENHSYTLATLTRGDFFGELALIDDDRRTASAIAVKESKLAVIFKPDLDEFIEKYPKKGIKILRGISQIITTRLKNVNQDFFTIYTNSLNKEKELKDGTSNKKNISAH